MKTGSSVLPVMRELHVSVIFIHVITLDGAVVHPPVASTRTGPVRT